MSTVLVLTPVIIGSWPAISAAAVGAAAALGFAVKHEVKELQSACQEVQESQQEVEVAIKDSDVVAESLHTNQEIVLTRGMVTLRLTRDERGRCIVCAKGKGHSKTELKLMAEEFSQKLSQCFVYNRVMQELKGKNFNIVNEEVMNDDSIRIHVRRWVD